MLMNLLNKQSALAIALVAMMSLGLTSCSKEDPIDSEQLTVRNNGTYTLNRFRIVFLNSSREKLSEKDCGTLAPGDQASANIPTAAKEYYMATYMYSEWYFSPYYDISYTNLTLSDSEIGEWKKN